MGSLESHLQTYGIRYFSDERYYEWGAERLEPKIRKRLNQYMNRFARGVASPKEHENFYDLIASPAIAPVVHSFKADSIRASGEFAAEHILGRRSVLDVGCGLGYLTTWYALSDPERAVIGIDRSRPTVEEAMKHATRLGLTNCSFVASDVATWSHHEPFEAIVDTQSVQYLKDPTKVFGSLRRQIAPGGTLVSIPAIGDRQEARLFVDALLESGFFIEKMSWVRHADQGDRLAYPAFVARTSGPSLSIDMEREYEEIMRILTGQSEE